VSGGGDLLEVMPLAPVQRWRTTTKDCLRDVKFSEVPPTHAFISL